MNRVSVLLPLCAVLSLSACNAMPADSYAVILTAHNGNEYVLDYGLTESDCSNAIASDWPDALCVKEPAQ